MEALSSLGLAFQNLGRAEEAIACYDQALAIRADLTDVLSNRGVALQALKRSAEAIASYERSLALQPDSTLTLYNLGNALAQAGRPVDALAIYDRALAVDPNHFDAQVGNRPTEAVAAFERAHSLRPNDSVTHINLATTFARLGRYREAVASYEKAMVLGHESAEAHYNHGVALAELNDQVRALASYDKALRLKPDHADALYNRGGLLMNLDRAEEAVASYDQAVAIRPSFMAAYYNRGNALSEIERPEDAIDSFDKVVELQPDYYEARANRGLAALLAGRFSEGWKDYEYRRVGKSAWNGEQLAIWPGWSGEDPWGKRIVVFEEQGLGDTIQFCRYLPLLASRGARVTFVVRSSMHRLLRALMPTIQTLEKIIPGQNYDFQCSLMSLPGIFQTRLENIPAKIPYLRPEPPHVARWRKYIGGHGFRIGICWQGNPEHKKDAQRSFPLRSFQSIAAIPGVRLISLQKLYGVDQLLEVPAGMKVETLGNDFEAGTNWFIDTAAAMARLDLIITCDTAIAHLAGALGQQVWTLIKYAPDWRWLLNRQDSPWYPTMTLYRQRSRHDWEPVFDTLAKDVGGLVRARMADAVRR